MSLLVSGAREPVNFDDRTTHAYEGLVCKFATPIPVAL
jgi:hypothetical protein